VKLATAHGKTVAKTVRLNRTSAFGGCAVGITLAFGAMAISSFALNAVPDDAANTAFEFWAFEPGVHLLHLKLAEFVMVETSLIVRMITEIGCSA